MARFRGVHPLIGEVLAARAEAEPERFEFDSRPHGGVAIYYFER